MREMKREVFQELVKLPNLFTLYRLLSVPVLWVLAILDYRVAFGIGFILAALTDSIDGYIARRLDMVSEFGSKFDSLADYVFGPSVLGWLMILKPEIFQENVVVFLVAVFIAILNFLVGWVRFKCIGNLHLYSAKFAGVIIFFFLAHTFLFEGYNQTFFYFVVSVYVFELLEGLAIFLTQDHVDEHMGSIVLVYKRNKERRVQSG
jgi:phosphatidylglycerophosphate synthase